MVCKDKYERAFELITELVVRSGGDGGGVIVLMHDDLNKICDMYEKWLKIYSPTWERNNKNENYVEFGYNQEGVIITKNRNELGTPQFGDFLIRM